MKRGTGVNMGSAKNSILYLFKILLYWDKWHMDQIKPRSPYMSHIRAWGGVRAMERARAGRVPHASPCIAGCFGSPRC